MKSSSRQRRVRSLKAKAATVDSSAEFDNYGAEPNMKLSHAFMVVLALHVVAVGGLFAFNKVKAGHSKVSEKLQTEVAAAQAAVTSEEAKPLVPASIHEVAKEVTKVVEAPVAVSKPKEQAPPVVAKKIATVPVVQTPTATKSAFLATKTPTAPTTVAPVASSAVAAVANMASSTAVAAAPVPQPAAVEAVISTEYTIVKGDNPYKIAKRFHVSYDQLIKFNNISDPRKMQIGQKIRIPKKSNG